MNDMDEWLNALGIDTTPSDAGATPERPWLEALVGDRQTPEILPAQTAESQQSLSDQDITEILNTVGFREAEEAEAEEITEEEVFPVPEEEAIQAVQDLNEEYPPTNPDVSQSTPTEENQEENNTTEYYIRPNSPTLLIDESTSRFSGTEWYNEIQRQKIILAGIGGIGSWTALQLARMVPENLVLYDDDIVEKTNMSGQLYAISDVGKPKVDAICGTISTYTTAHSVYAINQKFTSSTEAGDIMICGFDSMSARKNFFKAWFTHVGKKTEEEKAKCLYLDGRLNVDTLQVFCIRGDDPYNMARYEKEFLFDDSKADDTVCSMKQTTYLACMIGSIITNLFTNHVANLLNPIIPYDLPFFTEYDARNVIFKTQS